MSNPDTWTYGTVLRHSPFIPLAPEETLVMFVRWEQKNIRERTPVLLVLQDGSAPGERYSMNGHVDAIKIHARDWEVIG